MQANASQKKPRRLVRRLLVLPAKYLLFFVLAIVFLVALALSIALGTVWGRAHVWQLAQDPINGLLPGRIEVERIDQLSPWGLDVVGIRIFDPQDTLVVSAQHLKLTTDLSEILRGTIAARELILESASVDARVLEPRRGLLAAFIDPDAPASPPSPGPPPDIVIRGIKVERVLVHAPPTEPVGAIDAHLDALEGDFSLTGGQPAATVRKLKLRATREGQALAELEATADIAQEQRPSTLSLHLDSLGMSLDTDILGVLPSQPNWNKENVSIDLSIQDVTAERLSELLRDPSLKDAFRGEVDVQLKADGQPADLTVHGGVSTAGGEVEIVKLSLTDAAATVELSVNEFHAGTLRDGLPQEPITFHLQAEANGLPPADTEFRVTLSEASFDGESLPHLELTGTKRPQQIDPFRLQLRDGDSHLDADGTLGLDGSANVALRLDLRDELVARVGRLLDAGAGGRITANVQAVRTADGNLKSEGRLELTRARWNEISVDSVGAGLNLSGIPPELHGRVEISAAGLSTEGAYVDDAELTLMGGPEHYTISLNASGGQEPPPATEPRAQAETSAINLQAEIARQAQATEVQAHGEGRVAGHAFELQLERTSIRDAGAIDTDGLELRLAGQELTIQGGFGGRFRAREDGLRLVSGTLDLSELSEALDLPETICGTARLDATLWGDQETPILALNVAGEDVGLANKPAAMLNLEARFDSKAGQADTELHVSSGQVLGLELQAEATFAGGAGYAARLPASETDIQLTLTELSSEFVSPYLPAGTLPFAGSARGKYHGTGSLNDPSLDAKTELHVLEGEEQTLIEHRLSYDAGALRTELSVQDESGPWAKLLANLQLRDPPPGLDRIANAFKSAPAEAQWEVQLSTKPRELKNIPLVTSFVEVSKLPPAIAGIQLDAQHQPGQEPQVDARLTAKQSQSLQRGACSQGDLLTKIHYQHMNATNELVVVASLQGTELLRAQVTAEQALLPLLRGKKPRPGPVNLNLQSQDLKIEELPFVCGVARGTVSAHAEGSDLLGASPELEVDMKADNFSLGDLKRLSIELAARAHQSGGEVEAQLQGTGTHRESRANLSARLPWTFSQGKFEMEQDVPLDLDLDLHHLPIAPLLPPKGAISYASGTLDGELQVRGSLQSPLVDGQLDFEQLEFTTTALAQPLSDVNGRVTFRGRRITVEHFEAHDREGVLTLAGTVDLTNTDRIEAKVEVVAEDFPLRQQGQVVAITNVKAQTHSIVEPHQTVVRLRLQDVDTWLENASIRTGISLDHHPEFVVNGQVPPELQKSLSRENRSKKRDSKQEDAPEESASPKKEASAGPGESEPSAKDEEEVEPHEVHIKIDAEERFWIKRDDFAVKLSALLDTEIRGDEVRVRGDVTIDRGYLQLFGKVFDLERESYLKFIGSNPPNPVLSLEAIHKTRGGNDVSVRITGRGDEPVLTFFVDGDEVDASIAVQAMFGGREKEGDSKSASTQAQSFVSGLTAGVLATAARRELGAAAPIIMIDPADKAGEGRIRAGFDLDDIIPEFMAPIVTGMYIEGIVARESSGESSQATTMFGTLLEIYFPKNFYTAGQYGPGTTWSVDVGWQL